MKEYLYLANAIVTLLMMLAAFVVAVLLMARIWRHMDAVTVESMALLICCIGAATAFMPGRSRTARTAGESGVGQVPAGAAAFSVRRHMRPKVQEMQ